MDDWGLIQEYRRGSVGAFEALVGRYLPMVYGVALREVGRHHLAEDITQAVFALLARKAPHLRERTAVAGWLFRATRYACANARKMERRRRHHEVLAGRLRLEEVDRTDAEAPRETQMRLLDDALERLGSRERDAILLRYYRQMSVDEVAGVLRVSPVAARKRVERAVGKLRRAVGASHELPGATAMVVLLGALGVAAGTPATAEAVTVSALACAKGAAGTESAGLLMKGALKMMMWAKIKVAALVFTGVAVLGGGSVTVQKLMAHNHADSKPVVLADTAPAVAPEPIDLARTQLNILEEEAARLRDQAEEFRRSRDLPAMREGMISEIDHVARLRTASDEAAIRQVQATAKVDALTRAVKQLAADNVRDGDPAMLEANHNLQKAQSDLAEAQQIGAVLLKSYEDAAHTLQDKETAFHQYEIMDRKAQAIETVVVERTVKQVLDEVVARTKN